MDKRMINKGGRLLECPILRAAATPLAPRVECSVFGCRSSERDHVSFHPLPQDPDRCSQWLELINRQDLTNKFDTRQHAMVCSMHFLPEQIVNGVLVPNALPSLVLPSTKHQFVLDGSADLLSEPLKVEADLDIDIKSEPEAPPTCNIVEKPQPSPGQTEIKNEPNVQVFQHTTPTVNSTGKMSVPPQFNSAPILFSKLTNLTPGVIILNQNTQMIAPINATQIFNTTQTPFNATQTPFNATQTSLNITLSPFNATQTSINGTQTSLNATQTSINGTQTSLNATQTSINGTQTSLNATQIPLSAKQTSLNATQTYLIATQTSSNATQSLKATHISLNATQTSVNSAQTSVNATQIPLNATHILFNPAQIPFNTAQIPLNPIQISFNPTQIPLKQKQTKLIAAKIPIKALGPHQFKTRQIPNKPELPEPTYLDHQVNIGTQTDIREAFYRKATFSAVEHINIPPPKDNRLADIMNRSVASQTTPELVEVFIEDVRKKLGKELDEANRKLHGAENPTMEKTQFLKGCDKYLDEKIANFVKSHSYLSNKFVGNKYPMDFKIFALKLHLWNPKSYKFVEKFFDLPSKDVIKRFRMPVRSGINQSLMEALKVKIDQMSILGKKCVVCFDVVQLKKNLYYDVGLDYLCGLEEIDGVVGEKQAECAVLIAVRGLYTRWKQPVSFALVSEERRHPQIQAWLHKTIEYLIDMGLNVKALITSPDEEFLEYPKEPYFELKGGKIYNIIDFPDLLKTARDELIENDFHIGSTVIKWEHVLNVYHSDKTQELKLLSNLTDKHVRPDETSKDDVKLVKQLFSSDLAAAMHFYVLARLQNKETKATVKFMKNMKELYEILYSRSLSNAYRSTTAQNKFLNEILEYFKTIQTKNSHGNVNEGKFVSGLKFTLKSIKSLAADLKKCNVNYLVTKNLSKDFMQDYFKDVKRACELPSPIEFTRGFRKLLLSNILNNTKNTATGDDMMGTLVKISEYVKADMNKKEQTDDTRLNIGINDYKIRWPSNEYIAGYILHKCLEKHTCEKSVKNICDYYKFEKQNGDVLIETFQCYNGKNVDKFCNVRPPVQLQEFVNLMEKRFNEYYYSVNKNNMNFGWNLYCIIEKDSFKMPCECFPNKFLRMLYIRLKIFSSVKEYNKINKTKR
ncbi:uncharacterized protein LOC133531511 [Cydia pomonella]|uniref:uncharacterized protein LOC133531511 n=1 Tax=Cydia pomonella TaxID=82600 RepID=UPI002ADDF23D|nr:uncharacterized protein LOC133531511 [Cydia pomonella]